MGVILCVVDLALHFVTEFNRDWQFLILSLVLLLLPLVPVSAALTGAQGHTGAGLRNRFGWKRPSSSLSPTILQPRPCPVSPEPAGQEHDPRPEHPAPPVPLIIFLQETPPGSPGDQAGAGAAGATDLAAPRLLLRHEEEMRGPIFSSEQFEQERPGSRVSGRVRTAEASPPPAAARAGAQPRGGLSIFDWFF